ncbi:MAG: SulP family inorganic anion transporter [Woeseiaceae bacterium]
MATSGSARPSLESLSLSPKPGGKKITHYLPFLDWLVHYRREDMVGDLLAGVIVAIMLVPQGMAYAQLAGLPPQIGLYASILPLIIYGLLGTSRTLAVGPVAIVSLLVATGVAPLADQGSAEYLQLALTLAFLVAVIQFVMGVVRAGFLVNFLSHPVVAGFTSAAAIVIGFSQLKHLIGVDIPRTHYFYEQVLYATEHIFESNVVTLIIGLGSIAVLFYFNHGLAKHLKKTGLPESVAMSVSKSGPLVVVLLGTVSVAAFGLFDWAGVKTVGDVPAGLPAITLPVFDFNVVQLLLPTALAISFVGFMESISVAKSLASKRRQKVDADQELVALGTANIGAAFTGGYPVTGGFSRSVVNFAAGANTGLASIITAVLVALTVIFLTPLFYYLPNAVLAAVIMVAVFGLIDVKTFKHVWSYNKADAASMIITFIAVLAVGVETGILAGVVATLLLFLWRTSRPHIAEVGRIGGTELYRNVARHEVETWQQTVAIRVDGSLYFADTKYLEDVVLQVVADRPELKYFVLIGIAVNAIDASALETLESLNHELHDAGVELHLAGFKGPITDRLRDIGFIDHIGPDRVHLSTHDAMKVLGCA